MEVQRQAPGFPAFLAGGGETGSLMRGFNWQSTELGAAEGWHPSLKAMVRMALTTQQPVFIFWGTNHICLYNDAYRRSLGPEKHPAMLGARGREMWSEIWDIIGPQVECVMSGQGSTWHENQLIPIVRHGQLEQVYWTYSYGPIDDEHAAGGIGGVLVICTETTEHVVAKQKATEERERFARLFDQAPAFIAMLTGPDFRFEFANPACMHLIGGRPVLGKTFEEALPEAVEQGYLELLQGVYRRGEALAKDHARYAIPTDAGRSTKEQFVDFVFQPIVDAVGSVSGILVIGVDVTNRTRADSALRTSEEQLRLAIDAGEIGFWDVDVVNDRLYWPARVKAMFGISPGVPVTRADFFAGLHPDDFERVSAAFGAAVDPIVRAAYDVEFRTIGKEDKQVRWIAAKGRGRYDENGACLRVIGTARDITSRKTTEARLKDLNEMLEVQVQQRTYALMATEEKLRQSQKMEAIGQLTGGIAHDFNNLLQAVTGAFDLIRRRPEDSARVVKWAEAGLATAERGTKLTSQLLAFSRTQKLESVPVDVTALILAMAELFERTLGPKITVKFDLDPHLSIARCDPVQLEISLLNLAINARDAMPQGGNLVISTRLRTLKNDQELASDDYVEVSVGDTGTGMSPEIADRAFEPFFTTKGVGKGTGIGLSQVYVTARQAGGTARIETAKGLGTTVRLYLQRSTQAVVTAPKAYPDIPLPKPHSMTILVIDDDDAVRDFLRESLTSLGFDTVEAEDGYAGLAALDRSSPDLVIVDFAMPGITGADVVQQARAKRPELPFIFATGYSNTEAIESAAGADVPLLRKPFRIDELEAVILRALPGLSHPRTGV